MKKLILAMLLFVAVGCTAPAANNQSQNNSTNPPVSQNGQTPVTPAAPADSGTAGQILWPKDANGYYVDPQTIYGDLIKGQAFNVAWYPQWRPIKNDSCPTENNYCVKEYYGAGLIRGGVFSGKEIYIGAFMNCMGACWYHFIDYKGTELILDGYGSDIKLSGITDLPETINVSGTNYTATRSSLSQVAFKDYVSNGTKIFTDPVLGDIYRDSSTGCLFAQQKDHMTAFYELTLPFLNKEKDLVDITFNDGSKNSESYLFRRYTCGSYCYMLWYVDEAVIKPDQRLEVVGRTSAGDAVYGIKDQNDQALKDIYDDHNTVQYSTDGSFTLDSQKNRYTYAQFIKLRPLLYWKDPFGHWVQFRNHKTDVSAEMCKPVIYLYPNREMDLSVQVKPNGGITYSDPAYGTGWNVRATPDGKITDLGTGKTYDYLFWEGIGFSFSDQATGWVISKDNISRFIDDKVSYLGLRGKELADFKEYWAQRLNEHPYYQISFVPQVEFNQVAPLKIGPVQPTTLIRIMMTAKGLDSYKEIAPQKLDKPAARSAFTAVEWGGVVWK
jgi:hypothetical protein